MCTAVPHAARYGRSMMRGDFLRGGDSPIACAGWVSTRRGMAVFLDDPMGSGGMFWRLSDALMLCRLVREAHIPHLRKSIFVLHSKQKNLRSRRENIWFLTQNALQRLFGKLMSTTWRLVRNVGRRSYRSECIAPSVSGAPTIPSTTDGAKCHNPLQKPACSGLRLQTTVCKLHKLR